MEWKLTEHPSAVVVELCSNPVNKQNPDYFKDVNAAFNRLDNEFPGKPVILTAQGKVFSAGIDFDYCFPMFQKGDISEVAGWFASYRQSMMRIFTSPRLTIAALNGHAFAGGLVLALCCDYRIAAAGDAKFALNEVPIGVPMPSVYTELLRHRLGSAVTEEMILFGKVYNVEQAKELRVINEIAEPSKLVETALKLTESIHQDCWPAYAQTKKSLLHPVLSSMQEFSEMLDRDTYGVMVSKSSVRMHTRKYEALKKAKGR